MTRRIITATLAVALLVGVQAQYRNATNIKWAVDLDCTSCIRAGFDYCIYGDLEEGTPTGTNWNCSATAVNPSIVWPDKSINNGYVCSNGLADQMTGIIAGCRPAVNNPVDCGSYMIDLTDSSFHNVSVKNLDVNQSCTYRVFSPCGYPAAYFTIRNQTIIGDFDVAWAAQTGIQRDDDLGSGWDHTQATSWTGSMASGDVNGLSNLLSYGPSQPKVNDVDFRFCNSSARNLWLTVTRTKVTPAPKAVELLSEDFLAETPRQLQRADPGLRYFDIELGFTHIQGGFAKTLGAISFALIAVLSVFAF